eukprot:332081_1
MNSNGSQASFVAHLTLDEANELDIGDYFDFRLKDGKYCNAKIIKKSQTNIKFSYIEGTKQVVKWKDYSKHLFRLATARSISTRVANRLIWLKKGDYVDICPTLWHSNWIAGKVKELDPQSGQIRVYCFIDNTLKAYWTHLDNLCEIAQFGTKYELDLNYILQVHWYDAYFKVDEDNYELILNKLQNCCKCIDSEIIPQKRKESVSSLVKYCNELHYKFYSQYLEKHIKRIIQDDSKFAKAKMMFFNMYNAILVNLAHQTDQTHLQISNDLLLVNSNSKDSVVSEHNKNAMLEVKMKWHTINDQEQSIDSCQQNNNPFKCISLIRIKYLLQLFEAYFIKSHKQEHSNDNSDKLDFVSLLTECIYNDNDSHAKYDMVCLINDFYHIKEYHINDIAKDKRTVLIKVCPNEVCIINTRNMDYENRHSRYFGYTVPQDINIIEFFIKLHIYLSHQQCLIRYVEYDHTKHNSSAADVDEKNNVESTTIQVKNVKPTEKPPLCMKFNKFVMQISTDKDEKYPEKSLHKFRFGEQFWYHKYFQKQKKDHYIRKAYFSNLKEELLNNDIYPILLQSFHVELLKAVRFTTSFHCKQLKAANYGKTNDMYEVPVHSIMCISRMLSLLVYTNLTELQYNFKKYGCRRIKKNETIKDIAKRNQKIANWYQLFISTIFFFGCKTNSKDVFYHGLSTKLLFSSFNPKFLCPISTTMTISVAQQFATLDGIILELKPGVSSQNVYMDVSWLSNHPGEEEQLFAFASNLEINDIRFNEWDNITDQRTGNRVYLNALRLFDSIFSSNSCYSPSVTKNASQELLIKFVCNYIKKCTGTTFIDELLQFHAAHGMLHLNKLIKLEQYDSDAFLHDIQIVNQSMYLTCLSEKYSEKLSEFDVFIQCYQNRIPQYLLQLFECMVSDLQHRAEDIFIIKSQYTKLKSGLKSYLLAFDDHNDLNINCNPLKLPLHQIKLIQEFKWTIDENLLCKIRKGQTVIGPEFEMRMSSTENEKYVTFYPEMRRSISSPQNITMGIWIKSLPVKVKSVELHWGCYVKQMNYLVKEQYKLLRKGENHATYIFSVHSVANLKCVDVTIFLRS